MKLEKRIKSERLKFITKNSTKNGFQNEMSDSTKDINEQNKNSQRRKTNKIQNIWETEKSDTFLVIWSILDCLF